MVFGKEQWSVCASSEVSSSRSASELLQESVAAVQAEKGFGARIAVPKPSSLCPAYAH